MVFVKNVRKKLRLLFSTFIDIFFIIVIIKLKKGVVDDYFIVVKSTTLEKYPGLTLNDKTCFMLETGLFFLVSKKMKKFIKK